MRAAPRPGERGAALIIVLWICAVVALLAGAFAGTVGLEARRTANMVAAAQARALIDAGIAHAVARLTHPDPSRRPVADGRPLAVVEDGAALTLRLWDETGRLDLNRAPPELLSAVLAEAAGADGRRAAALALARREAGRPLSSVLDLGGPDGLDAAAFARVAALVTVHNALETGGVSAAAAPEALLRAWPKLSGADARGLLEARERGQPVREDLPLRLATLGLMSNAPAGQVFTVRVQVETDASARASAEAILWIAVDGRSAYRVLEWREPAPDLSFPDTDPPR